MMPAKIVSFITHDIRFPTSKSNDGSDAMNKDCDYSAAYVVLKTDATTGPNEGHGMTFVIGRGCEVVCLAIEALSKRLIGKDVKVLFSNMGQTWSYIVGDSQLRWIGPEKGVIHLATAAVVNALWDLYAKVEKKPLWKLIVDMSPEEMIRSIDFRYIRDAITEKEALDLLKRKEAGKKQREEEVIKRGYPAYTTSVGWLGYDDDKVERLTKEALAQGFNHFKLKVGASVEDDRRRCGIVRKLIGEDRRLMVDANQVWDVNEAIEYMQHLKEFKPWFIEEPTSPDDILGHATIRKALKPTGVGVATGEHCHNRVMFKQLLQAEAIDVCQIDSCRLGGVNEVLSVILMAAKFGVLVVPHAGGVGLCEMVQHLSIIDFVAISGSMEENVLEYVNHLHEHFYDPVVINKDGRYRVPSMPGYSIEMKPESIKEFLFPDGTYWVNDRKENEAANEPANA